MARKQIKAVPAVSLCNAALVLAFAHAADIAEANALESLTTSEDTRQAIVAMRDTFGNDTSGYLSAVVAIFGSTGIHHSKPDYIPGTLRADLEKALADGREADDVVDAMNRIKFRLGQARKVANWLADPVRVRDAEGKTLSEVYKAANDNGPKATRGDASEKESGKAEVMTLATLIGKFGVSAVLAECSKVLATSKATKTAAATLSALSVQVA